MLVGIVKNILSPLKAGYDAMTLENNDEGFDSERTKARIEAFMETLGVKKSG